MSSIEIVTTEPRTAMAVRQKARTEEIPSVMGGIFQELVPYFQKGVRCVGPPFAMYHSWSDDGTDMEVGFPISGPGVNEGRVRTIEMPAVRAAMAVHVGPYDRLMESYERMLSWMKENGHEPESYMWEEYLNSPEDTPPEELMTRMYWPIK